MNTTKQKENNKSKKIKSKELEIKKLDKKTFKRIDEQFQRY